MLIAMKELADKHHEVSEDYDRTIEKLGKGQTGY
jgi:hypothetical protein